MEYMPFFVYKKSTVFFVDLKKLVNFVELEIDFCKTIFRTFFRNLLIINAKINYD